MANGTDIKIVADENGILIAKFPDGSASTILVEIYESSYYGFLRVNRLKQEVSE